MIFHTVRKPYLLGAITLAAVAMLALGGAILIALLDDDDDGAPESTPTPIATATGSPTSPTATPSPGPRPSATPTPTATATATPTSAVPPTSTATATQPAPSTRIDHGPRGTNQVALTLDMGGRVEPALDIMNWLISNRVPATIFMTGAMADSANTDAGRQVLQLVEDHPELFDLGNHSYSHPYFTTLSAAEMVDELRQTEASIGAYVTSDPRPIWRPPFGDVNQTVLNAVGPAGYAYTVMWDVDTIDWKPENEGGPTAAEIVSKVVANAQGGSIVLMHLGGYNTYSALPAIVDGLRAKGLEPVTLSTMLGY